MKVCCLGGVPCSGKTTIARRFVMRNMVGAQEFKFNKLRGTYVERTNIIVLGLYDEKIFAGTDRLSMAVHPDFVKWLHSVHKHVDDAKVFFEGDRLFTASVLSLLKSKEIETMALVLGVGEKERLRRRALRGDKQSPAFVEGRRTKYANILNQELATQVFHEKSEDTDFIIEKIEAFFKI